MARAQGARALMALALESTYGTAPASGYTRVPFARSTLGAEQVLQDSELLGYGRDPLPPVLDALNADGEVTVPIDGEAWEFWLRGAFGTPTGTTTQTFTSGSWTLPSMAIEVGLPEVPRYAMYTGCMVDRLSWQMTRSGLLTAQVGLIAQGEAVNTTTQAGTPATVSNLRFNHFHGQIKRNGAVLGNVVSAQVTYANNLDRIETIRSDGKIEGADPSMASLTGQIVVRFADAALVTQAIAGAPCELEFDYAITGATQAAFKLTAHAVYLPRPRISVEGPQGIQATFDWQAAQTPDGNAMCTVTRTEPVVAGG